METLFFQIKNISKKKSVDLSMYNFFCDIEGLDFFKEMDLKRILEDTNTVVVQMYTCVGIVDSKIPNVEPRISNTAIPLIEVNGHDISGGIIDFKLSIVLDVLSEKGFTVKKTIVTRLKNGIILTSITFLKIK